VISCASIVAKVTRDRLMSFYDQIYPDYRFRHHQGYGTPDHAKALSQHGPSFLHRRSFRPVSACVTLTRAAHRHDDTPGTGLAQ
jgi:ribonuclease HII